MSVLGELLLLLLKLLAFHIDSIEVENAVLLLNAFDIGGAEAKLVAFIYPTVLELLLVDRGRWTLSTHSLVALY